MLFWYLFFATGILGSLLCAGLLVAYDKYRSGR
jgi:hypothetical protein